MWMWVPPSSTMRLASAAYSSGVYGIAGHWSRLAIAPEIAQQMMTGSSRLKAEWTVALTTSYFGPPRSALLVAVLLHLDLHGLRLDGEAAGACFDRGEVLPWLRLPRLRLELAGLPSSRLGGLLGGLPLLAQDLDLPARQAIGQVRCEL